MQINYQDIFRELEIEKNPIYPHNDIGIAKLFFELHSDVISYLKEPSAWFLFNGSHWQEDKNGLGVSELCKKFVQAYVNYARSNGITTFNEVSFERYINDFLVLSKVS